MCNTETTTKPSESAALVRAWLRAKNVTRALEVLNAVPGRLGRSGIDEVFRGQGGQIHRAVDVPSVIDGDSSSVKRIPDGPCTRKLLCERLPFAYALQFGKNVHGGDTGVELEPLLHGIDIQGYPLRY